MILKRLGAHAHVLECQNGALLFSYERLTALRYCGRQTFRAPDAIYSIATRAHLTAFGRGAMPDKLSRSIFDNMARVVLLGG